MPTLPPPELTVTKHQARRFLLAHHRLLPPRKLRGKQGTLDYVRHVNCIQYDPINVVGLNSDLVLQSRVHGYKPAMLRALLYEGRKLLDGFDKMMSIFPVEDWPYFPHHDLQKHYTERVQTIATAAKLVDWVRGEIKQRGPLSSLDLEDDTHIDWWLTGSTERCALPWISCSSLGRRWSITGSAPGAISNLPSACCHPGC